jgi:hypothetical protein
LLDKLNYIIVNLFPLERIVHGMKHRFVQMIVVGRRQLAAVANRRGIHLSEGGELVLLLKIILIIICSFLTIFLILISYANSSTLNRLKQARVLWRAWEQAAVFGLARTLTSRFIGLLDEAEEVLSELRHRQLQQKDEEGGGEWYSKVQLFEGPHGPHRHISLTPSHKGSLPIASMWAEKYTDLFKVRH